MGSVPVVTGQTPVTLNVKPKLQRRQATCECAIYGKSKVKPLGVACAAAFMWRPGPSRSTFNDQCDLHFFDSFRTSHGIFSRDVPWENHVPWGVPFVTGVIWGAVFNRTMVKVRIRRFPCQVKFTPLAHIPWDMGYSMGYQIPGSP